MYKKRLLKMKKPQLVKECLKVDSQRRYAWAKFYESNERNHELLLENYKLLDKQLSENNVNKNCQGHLEKFIQDLYKKAKQSVECCVCLDVIESKDLEIKYCGHILHKKCWKGVEDNAKQQGITAKCPLCRK